MPVTSLVEAKLSITVIQHEALAAARLIDTLEDKLFFGTLEDKLFFGQA